MFTRLFNNIGLRSLINAAGLGILLLSLYWWAPLQAVQWFPFANWSWPLMNGTVYFFSFLLMSLAIALAYNEWQNGQHLFQGNYFYFIFFLLGSFGVYYLWAFSPYLLSLPLILVVLMIARRSISPKIDLSRLNFLVALLIGLFSFVDTEVIYLLLIPFLTSLFFGGLSLQSFGALLLGFGATLYFALAFDFFFDWRLMDHWAESLLSLRFQFISLSGSSLIGLLLLFSHWSVSMLISVGALGRYNNSQKRSIAFWFLLMLLALMGLAFLEHKGLWFSLALFPYAFFLSRAVQSVDHRWLKEIFALVPFAVILSLVFL